jgi:hypothetical protein
METEKITPGSKETVGVDNPPVVDAVTVRVPLAVVP